MQKTMQRGVLGLTAFAAHSSVLASSFLEYDGRSQLNMRPGVTEVSQEIFSLHMGIFWICTVIGVAVFAVMFYSMWKHRKSVGHEAAQFHESHLLEIAWTIVPFIIVIGMAVAATKTLVKTYDTSDADLTIKVTSSQWKWHYEYMSYGEENDLDFGFLSILSTPKEQFQDYEGNAAEKGENYLQEVDRPLVIPAGKKVRFLLTSDDVIHAFWIPDFGIKKDTVPGFINELWAKIPEDQTGTYRGFCAELCGKDHAFMPIVAEVVSAEEFDTWRAQAKADYDKEQQEKALLAASSLDMEEAMTLGKEVYDTRCAMCHGAEGQGGVGPAFAGTDLANNPDRRLEHLDIVVNGKGGMPAQKAILNAKEIAAVVTYERNAFGNTAGDLCQPTEVK